MSRHIDRNHSGRRAVLRVVGPLIAIIGLVLTVIGIVSFFSSFHSETHEMPDRFWMAFVGMPVLGVGLAISKFAFMGAVSRYVANEVAPVGKDVVNYMADGTKDAVREVATAVGEGLAASQEGRTVAFVRCHKCNGTNEASAKFCNQCGASLGKSIACPGCGELNDPDARFCDSCGREMA